MAKKILCVDNEVDTLETLKVVLTGNGYDVDVTKSGGGAVKKIKQIKYNLVIMDIMMPGMSGHHLAKIINKKYKHKFPIMFVTIVPRGEVDIKDVDGFVQKPFGPNRLLTEVNRVLSK
jgi:DNA-binding response OmpR family regulator